MTRLLSNGRRGLHITQELAWLELESLFRLHLMLLETNFTLVAYSPVACRCQSAFTSRALALSYNLSAEFLVICDESLTLFAASPWLDEAWATSDSRLTKATESSLPCCTTATGSDEDSGVISGEGLSGSSEGAEGTAVFSLRLGWALGS